ncbi:MAG: thiamine pyrophosphate-binding protein [Chlamydiae bacterium]|nr:thiamine pyrophosphate-binding protein [Chlamydiota bacterium]MBI3276248.1 thiamine pyrophosphate-binding protein [Chlamydiota bacterium]
MKLSDYVARFLAQQGIRHVFAVSGGASLHLIHALAETEGIEFICPQHEQAGAMAADGYSRLTGNLGAAISTSGPGATNMLTGVCCAYYDSVPVIYITGQVSTFRMKKDTGVRQMGFQETDTIGIYKSVTKYAVQILDAMKIRYELGKACHIAKSDRPGPVVIDIPDNIQREEINPALLEPFVLDQGKAPRKSNFNIDQCLQLLKEAKRPVVILGWGVRLAKAEEEAKNLVEQFGFPVAPTWAMADLFESDYPFLIGTFGTHGTRYANFAVQNADLILAIGTRLDTKATGSPPYSFARAAKKIVVDIDLSELKKFERFGLKIEQLIHANAKDFLLQLNQHMVNFSKSDISSWREQIAFWKEKYPICPDEYYRQKEINPYVFVKALSQACEKGSALFVDTGCAVAWMMQAFDFKADQRLYHDCNNTAMGWALPASIGGSLALGKKSVICVTGDGSLQMNIQELSTVLRYQLPIKIFLINNHGYSMIQQTQDQWLEGNYFASSIEGGLAFPDFLKVAQAYGYKTVCLSSTQQLEDGIKEVLRTKGPVFCNVEIASKERVVPQVKFGRPNEDADPLLERKEFLENMTIQPMEISLKDFSVESSRVK